jgi:hypothetical protein
MLGSNVVAHLRAQFAVHGNLNESEIRLKARLSDLDDPREPGPSDFCTLRVRIVGVGSALGGAIPERRA